MKILEEIDKIGVIDCYPAVNKIVKAFEKPMYIKEISNETFN